MMAREYRTRNRIVLDLLRAMKSEGSLGPTRLLTASNLSTDRLQGYLTDLTGRGWIEPASDGDRTLYALTDAGAQMLVELDRIDRFMADLGMSL